MLNHLIATIMICLGVANTTPISNYKKENHVLTATKKNATQTNNYTLDIGPRNTTTQSYYAEQPIENTYYPKTQVRTGTRQQITNYNNYINVIGNLYMQEVFTTVRDNNNTERNLRVYENYRKINNNLNYLYQRRTEYAYIYKLTPYNYNIENTITLKQHILIEEWENQNGIEWYMYDVKLIRNIYQTTEQAWDQYINQQITEYQPYNICRELENINNGFYYTKQQELITIDKNYSEGVNIDYIDEIEISITPKIDNYIVIEYIPTIDVVEMGQQQQQELVVPMFGSIYAYSSNNTLTGTNIIPDGTYEVVNIPGLMFEILGMPFAFVSQAFNLTLFPGTPYQINIANLFLSIIAIFVFVWLLLLFIKMKSGG